MTLHIESLENCLDVLDFFLDDMTRVWEARSGNPLPEFKEFSRSKILPNLGKSYSGTVVFENKLPVAIAWVEKHPLHMATLLYMRLKNVITNP